MKLRNILTEEVDLKPMYQHYSLTRLCARVPRGKRAFGKVPRNRGKNATLLSSLSREGITSPAMAVEGATEGATDGAAFEEPYVEHFLAPTRCGRGSW
jgi:hypothetical protein